ncbi:MAG: hypothetical protein OXC97_03495 [Candidatus Dadabacteria bacterium]|nr:hypothetical protein [Candidatus Dadabacteria bacterium]
MKTHSEEKSFSVNKIFVNVGKAAAFCMLSLLIFFSSEALLLAHDYTDIPIRLGRENNHDADSITAKDVTAGDMDQMQKLILHAKAHMKQLVDYRTGLAPFLQRIDDPDGDWQNTDENIYIFRMGTDGTIQTPHPRYPLAQGGTLNTYNPMERLRNGLMDEESRLGESKEGVACFDYIFEGDDRAACIASSDLDYQDPPFPAVLVAGLDHNFSDLSFSGLRCPYYASETSAADVVDRDTLKKFVEETARFYDRFVASMGITAFVNSLSCFRVLPWKNDSVYLFAMTEGTQLVVLNGNTPSLENKSLDVVDGNGDNVGELIVNALKDKGEHEGEFVEYLWDDPTDEVPATNEEGIAPGDVPKLSYVVATRLPTGGRVIWGSGIYPEQSDDDGCAIAGSPHAPRNAALNFLIIIMFLLPTGFLKKCSRKKEICSRSGSSAFLVCALAASVFLSIPNTASAHNDNHVYEVTAVDVTVADESKMKEFVLHAKVHWEGIDDPNDNIQFERSLTMDGGDWKNGTVYLMAIDEKGTIYTHPHYPGAQNGTLDISEGSEAAKLIAKADEEGCVEYVLNNENRVTCAVKFEHPVWKSELILVGGLHHVDDVSFDDIECPYFVSEIINEEPYFKQGVTANKVTDRDTLKGFVGEFRKHLTQQVEEVGQTPAKLATIRNCWRELPWTYKAVYLFIMTEDKLVFFNGNSPALENSTLDVVDGNGDNVGELIVNALKDKGEHEGEFVEYLWDDPTDEVPATNEEGIAPGDVPKLSYVVSFSDPDFFGGEKLIIGSGYHPQASGDDGCAIVSTSGNAKGSFLNLFLAASVLFSAVFLKNHFAKK